MVKIADIAKETDPHDTKSVEAAFNRLSEVTDLQLMQLIILGDTASVTNPTRTQIALAKCELDRRAAAQLRTLTYRSTFLSAALAMIGVIIGAILGVILS